MKKILIAVLALSAFAAIAQKSANTEDSQISVKNLEQKFSQMGPAELYPADKLKQGNPPSLHMGPILINGNHSFMDEAKYKTGHEHATYVKDGENFVLVSSTDNTKSDRGAGGILVKGRQTQALEMGGMHCGKVETKKLMHDGCILAIKNPRGEVVGGLFAGKKHDQFAMINGL